MQRGFWISVLLALCTLNFPTLVLAQASASAASNFRDSATAVYQQGVDVCGSDCEAELSGAVWNVGATLGPLSAAIASGNPQQIRDAVTNTAGALGSLCNVLRVDCPIPPVGPAKEPTEGEPTPMGGISCSDQCGRVYSACDRSATSAFNACNNNINEFVACRLQTPFCDWRTAPFDGGTYANCRNNSFYRQFLQECRCPVPPGQGERQGGCPAFFTQGVGQVGTGICEVSDGLGCARCCNAKCVGDDPRSSCRGRNREECDVCEWSRRTLLAGSSMRSSVCDAAYYRRSDSCEMYYQSCLTGCGGP